MFNRSGDYLQLSLRSVRRYLTVGIGSEGAPIGHSAHDEMLEIVVPFIIAWERLSAQGGQSNQSSQSGQNLAAGTGLERTGAWLALTDGIGLRSDHFNTWLSFSRLVARDQDQSLLAWYAQQYPARPQNLWQHTWQAVQENTLTASEYATPQAPLIPMIP